MNQKCWICLNIIENCIQIIECDHSFCRNCLQTYYKSLILEKQLTIHHFKCLICNSSISVDIMKDIGLQSEFDSYSLINNCIEGLNIDEEIVDCLNPDCNNKYIIHKDSSKFTNYIEYQRCNICKQVFCRKCCKPYASRCCNQTIYGQCPKCHIQIEKDNGCNFVKCQSQYCKGSTTFCCLCFKFLSKDNHYTHYKDNNPYGDCKSSVTANSIKCPGCYTYNPEICKIFEEYAFCQSKTCKNKKYCLKCSKSIESIDNHQCQKCVIQ